MYTWLENTAPCVLYSPFPAETVLAGWEEVGELVEVPLGLDLIAPPRRRRLPPGEGDLL